MKELLKILAFLLIVGFVFYQIGYLTARTEIINKILADKKDCYTMVDLANIILNK